MRYLMIIVYCFKYTLCFSPIIRVEEGELAGTFHELPNGRVVSAFLGVPYADPPIFDQRFKDPRELKPWIGTWNATKIQSHCLQIDPLPPYPIIGEEDCLYLNIYTPKLPVDGADNPLMDVMVYIHAGAFMFGGGGIYQPEYIMQNSDIVFVSINYRLGALGFFSTGDHNAPGNFGLKDQVAALKWIQRNIINFGGNPSSVTIFGCSAGGASIQYHFISPLSEGLFHKGISLSGTVLPEWTLPRNVTQKSIQLTGLIGCPTNSAKEMMMCLRRRPARAIIEQMRNFMIWRYCPFTPFGPVIEPESENAFLPSHPLDLLINGKVKDLPWMTSVNEKEGLYPAAEYISRDDVLKELNEKWNEIAPNLLMYNYSVPEEEKNFISNSIKKFYFGDEPISKETINPLVQMVGDRLFYNEIFEAIKLHNVAAKSNVYCYKFNYRGKYSLTNYFAGNNENYGASHADDLSYVVKFFPTSSEETQADKAMTKLISSIFINFMKTGDPTSGIDGWKPVTKHPDAKLSCLNIYFSSRFALEDVENQTISEFWKNVLPHEYPMNYNNQLKKDEL